MAGLSQQELLVLKQKVEVLAGERGDPRNYAIRMIYLTQLQELIGKLSKSASAVQVMVDALATDIQDLGQDVTTVQGDVAALQVDVGGLQGAVVQISGDIALVQQGLDDANNDLSGLEQDIIDLQIDIGSLADLPDEVALVKGSVNSIKTDVTAVVIPNMSQGAVAAAPTAAQFNALVDDVASLRQALASMKAAII